MSSTTRSNKDSNPDDFLITPSWCTRDLLRTLKREGKNRFDGCRVLDPCAGDGAILKVVLEEMPEASRSAIELDEGRGALCRPWVNDALVIDDALRMSWIHKGRGPDLICTNPPFSLAMPFLEKALEEIGRNGTVAFLLRLAWLASEKRVAFHKQHPSDVYVLEKRPSFAASLKCKMRKDGCSYREMVALTAPRLKVCPKCGAGIDVGTSDSADYGWFVYGPGRGNRWWILESGE